MSLTRKILTSSGQLVIANGLTRALGIFSLPLLTHWLAPAAYGQAALASTLISLVSVVFLVGLDMSYARGFLSRDPPNGEAAESFLWRVAGLAALTAAAVAGLIWMIHARRDAGAMPGLAVLVCLGTAGSLLLAMAQTRSRLQGRHQRLAFAVAVGGVLAASVTLLLAGCGVADERALVLGYVVSYIAPIIVLGTPPWRQLSAPSGLSVSQRQSLLVVGLPGIVTAPMYWVLSSSDRWFLQDSADAAAVGVYAIACTFGQLGMMVNSALLSIWLPEATRIHESGHANREHQLADLIVRLVTVMAITCLGVSVFGGDVLRWLSAESFHDAAALVPFIAAGVFFYGCYHLARTGMFLHRKLGKAALIALSGALFSLTANAILVPRFGMMAAATTQVLSFGLIAGLVAVVSQRKHPLPIPTVRIVAGITIMLLLLVASAFFPPISGWCSLAGKFAFLAVGIFSVTYVVDRTIFVALIRFVMHKPSTQRVG